MFLGGAATRQCNGDSVSWAEAVVLQGVSLLPSPSPRTCMWVVDLSGLSRAENVKLKLLLYSLNCIWVFPFLLTQKILNIGLLNKCIK